MPQRSETIGVIGSGLAGLATAAVLGARGYDVEVFEASSWLGGKAAVLQEQGFRFDMGPTILTIPSVLRRIFAEAGEDLDDHLDLRRLDPQWRSFFEDGSTLDLHEDVGAMLATLREFSPGSGADAGYQRLLALSERLNDISRDYYFWRSVGSLPELLLGADRSVVQMLKDVLSIRPHASVGSTIRSYVPDARVAQMLDHFTQYVGSAPDASPAVLCGVAHMQVGEGVWYPIGGTRAVPEALVKLGRSLGVRYRTETPIARILQDGDGRANGVLTADGEEIRLAAVVSNMDSVRTHRELLDDRRAQRRFDRRTDDEPACSGVVLYMGLSERYEHLAHHDFVFSRDPHEEFAAIYDRGEPAPDPTVYLCAPSSTEPGVAPPGGEALYALVHTPYLRDHHDWSRMLPEYREVILDKLARTAGLHDLRERIVFERALTPQDIHDRYRVLNGAIYGLSSHGRLTGAIKPANRSPDVPGLYLAGGAAHPGPGMPMVMMSGWIAADCVDQDEVAPRRAAKGAA